VKTTSLLQAALVFTGLTGSLIACAPDNTFSPMPLQEEVGLVREEQRKVDLLWVVDNSVSMEASQEKLRKGFGTFARKYLRSDWDIRTAVITTDMYIAHPSFTKYLTTIQSGYDNYDSKYLGRLGKQATPSFHNPTYGPNYSRLIPGMHDGPILASCYEGMRNFFEGPANCRLRDAADAPRGVEKCINPSGSETSVSQCVNTTKNDTVHSGKAILSTRDGSSIEQLIRDFTVNASVGTTGDGSERAFSSLFQLLKDNEPTETAFFRQNSFRIIVFLGDEDDQSVTIPARVPEKFSPFAMETLDCPRRTVDGHSFRLGACPKQSDLIKEELVKSELDSYFAKLDGANVGKNTYMVVPIVAINGSTLARLHEGFDLNKVDHDQGRRFLRLASLVGNGSYSRDIDIEDYSQILDGIGLAIIDRFRSFSLKREPVGNEQILVEVVKTDGTRSQIPSNRWTRSGKVLTITDTQFLLSINTGDRVVVSYQPKTAF
jgi:hypothetical protein